MITAPPFFLWHQDSLPAHGPGGEKKGRKKGGVTDVTEEVGGQREGNISHSDLIRERRRATIYSKRVRQQEGVGALVSLKTVLCQNCICLEE